RILHRFRILEGTPRYRPNLLFPEWFNLPPDQSPGPAETNSGACSANPATHPLNTWDYRRRDTRALPDSWAASSIQAPSIYWACVVRLNASRHAGAERRSVGMSGSAYYQQSRHSSTDPTSLTKGIVTPQERDQWTSASPTANSTSWVL